jgi:hypothetical protein
LFDWPGLPANQTFGKNQRVEQAAKVGKEEEYYFVTLACVANLVNKSIDRIGNRIVCVTVSDWCGKVTVAGAVRYRKQGERVKCCRAPKREKM